MSPATLAMVTSRDKWKLYKHLELLDDLLLYLENRDIHRLMTFMPPQHGKSLLISKNFPVWYLGHNPDHRVIHASYEASFATSWASKAKDIFELWANPIFGLELKHDSKAKNHWDIRNHDGGMDAAGAGGSQTGKQAHFFNIDDPHKNPQEARSPIFQERIYEWYLGAVDTRLPKDGLINLTQTRWDQLDLSGRILENEDFILVNEALEILQNGGKIKHDVWVVLSLQAIAGSNDILGREPGEALCPELFPIDILRSKQKRMDARDVTLFEALYQQNPVPSGGVVFHKEMFEWIHELPNNPKYDARGWDFAATGYDDNVPIMKRGASTVGLRMMITEDLDVIIADVEEFWKEPGQREERFAEIVKDDGKSVPQFIPDDPASGGKTQTRDFAMIVPGYNINPISERGLGDKEVRARPLANWGKVPGNKIYIYCNPEKDLSNHPINDYKLFYKRVRQMFVLFPRWKQKDIVDAGSLTWAGIFTEGPERADVFG